MPSEKVLEQKKAVVAGLTEKLQGAVSGVIVNYSGITVADDTKLRKDLREAGVDYSVVKNTLLKRAADSLGMNGLEDVLNGTTALAISPSDPVAAAKVLSEFAKKSNGSFTIKAGFVDGKIINADAVKALADLPSREVLVAQVLGGLNAPISGFVNVLNGNLRGLVVALNAIAEQKGGEAAE